VLIVQADVFAMPFRAGTFDRIFCFGMLQHTPDPRAHLENWHASSSRAARFVPTSTSSGCSVPFADQTLGAAVHAHVQPGACMRWSGSG
jgi:ubiquinone/menaquinone biosynthesis C-methylase UbiE